MKAKLRNAQDEEVRMQKTNWFKGIRRILFVISLVGFIAIFLTTTITYWNDRIDAKKEYQYYIQHSPDSLRYRFHADYWGPKSQMEICAYSLLDGFINGACFLGLIWIPYISVWVLYFLLVPTHILKVTTKAATKKLKVIFDWIHRGFKS